MRPEIIVALDVPSREDAVRVLDQMPDAIMWYKVGLELFTAEGPAALAPLHERGKHIFLDLKLHDIPNTVQKAVARAMHHGISMLTVHAGGGRKMLEKAREAVITGDGSALRLLAVTTLTSLDQQDLDALGIQRPLPEHTLALGRLAVSCGIDGLVCSPLEVPAFRQSLGREALLVTPGIRPLGTPTNGQKRVTTPADAVAAGADFLVMGRAITKATDPAAAVRGALEEVDAAYARLQ